VNVFADRHPIGFSRRILQTHLPSFDGQFARSRRGLPPTACRKIVQNLGTGGGSGESQQGQQGKKWLFHDFVSKTS